MWEAITAGHVQRGPSLLVPLVNICSVMDQQLDALQVPREDGLVDGSHTYIRAQKTLFRHSDGLRFDERGSPAETASLTGEVDGVQADSPGSDETSDPLQLPVFHVILENDVIGEVHAADGLRRG